MCMTHRRSGLNLQDMGIDRRSMQYNGRCTQHIDVDPSLVRYQTIFRYRQRSHSTSFGIRHLWYCTVDGLNHKGCLLKKALQKNTGLDLYDLYRGAFWQLLSLTVMGTDRIRKLSVEDVRNEGSRLNLRCQRYHIPSQVRGGGALSPW